MLIFCMLVEKGMANLSCLGDPLLLQSSLPVTTPVLRLSGLGGEVAATLSHEVTLTEK